MKMFLAVALGGAIGASARYGALVLFPERAAGFPWTTFWVNVAGCFALGLLIGLVGDQLMIRAFLGTGVLGGFTTFSTFAWQTDRLVLDGRAAVAASYVISSVLVGLVAAYLPYRLVELLRG
jgi:fluoride exporter